MPCAATLPYHAWRCPHHQQIIFNLLSNAMKFTPSGGKVELEIGRTAVAWMWSSRHRHRDEQAEIAKALRPYGQIGSDLAKNEDGQGWPAPGEVTDRAAQRQP